MEAIIQAIDTAPNRQVVERLLGLARLAESIALRSNARVRTVALVGLLSACWLAWRLHEGLALSLPASVIALLLLALPGLALFKVHRILRNAIGLPDRLAAMVARLQGAAGTVQQFTGVAQAKPDPGDGSLRSRLREFVRIGRTVRDLRRMGGEARALVSTMGGTLVLAHPLFLAVSFAATAAVLVLTAIAAITALAYLL